MVKGKVVLGVLAVSGILALSATVAQAGPGSPAALTSFFVCHAINGASLGIEVDAYSDEAGSGITRTFLTIGQAILACAQANLFPAGVNPIPLPASDANEINPTFGVNKLESLKCYNVSVSKKSGDTGFFDIEDRLFGLTQSVPPPPSGTEQDVPSSRDAKLICGPANLK
jgi:hypothetical protein